MVHEVIISRGQGSGGEQGVYMKEQLYCPVGDSRGQGMDLERAAYAIEVPYRFVGDGRGQGRVADSVLTVKTVILSHWRWPRAGRGGGVY